ncbi:hypothetical protein M758_6G058000 [Ceratodon purpureus]|nr:hypothetical protein M758_6G058000 [Ceratodon purpureus]
MEATPPSAKETTFEYLMLLGRSKILRHSTETTMIYAAMIGYAHLILPEVCLISIFCGLALQLIFKVLLISIIIFFKLYLFATLVNGHYLAKCLFFFNCVVLVNILFPHVPVLLSFKALATSVPRCIPFLVTIFYSALRSCWIQYWNCIGHSTVNTCRLA